jgi:hypothetical protein
MTLSRVDNSWRAEFLNAMVSFEGTVTYFMGS